MSLSEGDRIEELRVTPDKYLTNRYAGASGDFNPIHIDPEFAKSVGLPGTILHGLYMMGLVARANAQAAGGDPRWEQFADSHAYRPYDLIFIKTYIRIALCKGSPAFLRLRMVV